MAKFGFLSVLEEELDKHLDYDFAMDWDKKNHAVEVTFILEAQNSSNVETIDDKGEVSDEDVIFEDYVLFYNPAKSRFDEEDYLVTIPCIWPRNIWFIISKNNQNTLRYE